MTETENQPEPEPQPQKKAAPPPPAILPDNRRVMGTKMTYGHRAITMLRPICRVCQSGPNVPRDWFTRCPHDPYISVKTERWNQPEYADEVIDGKKTGNKIVTGTVAKERPLPQPNYVDVAVSDRINGGRGVYKARFNGMIRPSELKNELFPNGIAESCEWSECRWQQGLTQYQEGRFCREEEAKLAAWDVRRVPGDKKALEIGWNDESQMKRREQLDSVVIK